MLDQLFNTLDINVNEAKVYLSLAELGKAPAAVLAKVTQIPRSSAYTALDALLKKGLVAVEQMQGVSFYVANQPEALQRMVKEEKNLFSQRAAKKEASALELVPLLTPFFKNHNYSIPKLQFFEGTANVKSMLYDHCRDWQQSVSKFDNTWWGYQDHHFVETYREWLDYYWASMDKNEKILLLSNRSLTEKKLKNRVARRSIKVIPKESQFSNTIWVVGDYVVTIMTRQQPHYAFQLKDSVFAANQRLLFQMLWKFIR